MSETGRLHGFEYITLARPAESDPEPVRPPVAWPAPAEPDRAPKPGLSGRVWCVIGVVALLWALSLWGVWAAVRAGWV